VFAERKYSCLSCFKSPTQNVIDNYFYIFLPFSFREPAPPLAPGLFRTLDLGTMRQVRFRSFYQTDILQLVIYSTRHFVNLPFHRQTYLHLVILSYRHFLNGHFINQAFWSMQYFDKCGMLINAAFWSTRHFVNRLFQLIENQEPALAT